MENIYTPKKFFRYGLKPLPWPKIIQQWGYCLGLSMKVRFRGVQHSAEMLEIILSRSSLTLPYELGKSNTFN